MEEKKLTDEEIIKAHRTCENRKGCLGCPYTEKGIDCNIKKDIHRLQGENESLKKQIDELPKPRKKILANRVYSDNTLKKWSKEDLIKQIRILEHNWSCAEENFENSVKNSDRIFYEQKAEIERLTEENSWLSTACNQTTTVCLELQKQVDELKEKQLIIECHAPAIKDCECTKQAVKDTAKEIYEKVRPLVIMKNEKFTNGNPLIAEANKWYRNKFNEIFKPYGVEVE